MKKNRDIPREIRYARQIFKEIRKDFNENKHQNAIHEFEKALKSLLENYNTALYVNRFIVGDAVEILFSILLKAMGYKCSITHQDRTDLHIKAPNGKGASFSIKSSFTGKGDIRLINVMGSSENKEEWKEPTIFFIAKHGIYYADPYIETISIQSIRDAVIIKATDIIEKVPNDFRIIKIKIPEKPEKPQNVNSPAYDVVKSILFSINSVVLVSFFDDF